MQPTGRVNWSQRKRSKRRLPDGWSAKNFEPSSVYLYVGNFSVTDSRRHTEIQELFVPECPIIFPDRIDYAEWVAVDAMDYGDNFDKDFRWFLGIVENQALYNEIVSQASDHLVDLIEEIGPNPIFKLDKLLGRLVIPLMLERMTTRRILLWLFRVYGEMEVVGRRLSYRLGNDKQWPGLRTLMSRCGLALLDVQCPETSDSVFQEEKAWLGST